VRSARGWLFPFGFGWDPKSYPTRAIDFLWAQSVRGPIFNTDVWASSLLLRGKGRHLPVFVDARLEAYPEEFWRDSYYRVLQAAPGWQDVLDRYDVQCAMVRRQPGQADDRIGDVLWDDPGWGLVYWDDWAMLFLRRRGRAPRNNEILESWEFDAFSPRRPQEVEDLRGEALERAIAQLLPLIEWEEDSFLPRWALAAARARQGRGEEAVDIFDRLAPRAEARSNPAFRRSRAGAELVAGHRERWERLLAESDADSHSAGELFASGVLLGVAGKTDEAIAFYRETLAADPSHGDARNNLALLLARQGETAEAIALIDEALRRSPEDPYYIASQGEVLFFAGDVPRALAEFRRSLDLLPVEDRAAREEVMRWILRLE